MPDSVSSVSVAEEFNARVEADLMCYIQYIILHLIDSAARPSSSSCDRTCGAALSGVSSPRPAPSRECCPCVLVRAGVAQVAVGGFALGVGGLGIGRALASAGARGAGSGAGGRVRGGLTWSKQKMAYQMPTQM